MYGQTDAEQYKTEFDSYYGFLLWAEELSDREREVYLRYKNWLIEVEKTRMNNSYKMVVLLAMLERGVRKWHYPVNSREIAPFFHRYFMEKEYRKKLNFSEKNTKNLWKYDEEGVSKLNSSEPMTHWSQKSKPEIYVNIDCLIIL